MVPLNGETNRLIEWEYVSSIDYPDPFSDIELDILITTPSGTEYVVPAFWRGGLVWGARFIAKEAGTYHIITRCSDCNNKDLHHIEHTLNVTDRPHTLPPCLKMAPSKKWLTDEAGKPFFWFADTWWMALSERLRFSNEFQQWIAHRKSQGFNAVMLVAGLFPDMDSFDPRGKNEAGFPWEEGYTHIKPAYFDAADARIAALIDAGFIPVILGSWGHYLLKMGEEKMRLHWRYLIARWGCYPVVWCLAGEATMPFYTSKQRTDDMYALHEGWTRLARYVRQIEPFGNLITIHPTEVGRDQLQDSTLIDFNLIQSSHHDYASVKRTIELLRQETNRTPAMPVIMGESNYEGILKNTDAKMQRLTFWSAILNGAKGYSYGANGVWQINTKTKPFGPSPHGESWGNTPWEESLFFDGATQLGYAKNLLERYPWWEIEPHPEWLSPSTSHHSYKHPQVAGIPGKLRIVYFYATAYRWWSKPYRIVHLEKNVHYRAYFWDPSTGETDTIGTMQPNKHMEWKIPKINSAKDYLLILEAYE